MPPKAPPMEASLIGTLARSTSHFLVDALFGMDICTEAENKTILVRHVGIRVAREWDEPELHVPLWVVVESHCFGYCSSTIIPFPFGVSSLGRG